jgi:hypothetical protein
MGSMGGASDRNGSTAWRSAYLMHLHLRTILKANQGPARDRADRMILVLLRRLNSTKEKKRLLRSLPSTKRETMPTAASTLALETVADRRSCGYDRPQGPHHAPLSSSCCREFDLICRRRHWAEDRDEGGFARSQVLAFQSAYWPRRPKLCMSRRGGIRVAFLGESNPPFTSGDDSWRLRRDLDYWVMTPQAMRSPALPAGSLL